MLFLFLLLTQVHAETVVTQVAGQAGDQVITTREVQINSFVETALFPDDKSKPNYKLPITDKRFSNELTRVLIEWVVFKEADVFSAAVIPEEDVTKSMAVIKSVSLAAENRSYWEGLAPTTQELHEMITRKLRAKRFIQFKTRASVVPVTDAEALQYFQKNRLKFGNFPFAQFKDNIKSALAQEQASARIHDWFELLQKKYRVRKVALNGKSPHS